ncbi:unnamed protein product [Thlaspi arvense]|uniref:Uncharacterized protein n=1 Tax=Thlaspi arvense TaxID=13288 RepID=A0AAU9RBK3_THLAR|nr:unnamed protein product [Thlaspi arvense]
MVPSSAFISKDSSSSLSKNPLTNFSNDQSPLAGLSYCRSEQSQEVRVFSSTFSSMDLPSSSSSDPFINLPSSSLIEDQALYRAFANQCGVATDSLNPSQGKYSVFLYNHDNATFTQLGGSASSSFDQVLTPFNNNMSSALLGAQGFVGDGSCINNNIPALNPFLELGQCASWNQTASYVDPMMFSSSYC